MPASELPDLLDYSTPEAYSEALRSGGHLAPGVDGVLTTDEGLLSAAAFDADGYLRFIDRDLRLSPLYRQERSLRPDAAQVVADDKRARDASYDRRGQHA